jgi:hypothetical protein
MKRIITIGYLFIATAVIPAIALMLAYSLFLEQKTANIKVIDRGDVWKHVNAAVEKGCLVLFNQAEVDGSGDVTPWIDANPRYLTPREGREGGQIILPGIAVRYGQITLEGDVAWSFRLSLLIPLALSLAIAVLLRRRLRRNQARTPGSNPHAPAST